MINKLIEYSITNRWLVLAVAVVLLLAGVYASREIAVDAIPDLSDVQVIVQTEYAGQPPQVVEDQVTYPLSTALLAVPKAKNVRGFSYFGLSFAYVIFEDGTDLYWARSRVLEYLSQMSGRLPAGVTPQLGPDATGVGWVYQYALVDKENRHDPAELRSLQDWFLKYELSSLDGVAEVASVGGFVRQYQIEVDPRKLEYYGLPLKHVIMAVKKSSGAVGGRLLELGETNSWCATWLMSVTSRICETWSCTLPKTPPRFYCRRWPRCNSAVIFAGVYPNSTVRGRRSAALS